MRYDEELLSLIDDFARGDDIAVVEMGGLGAGYELAIWSAALELLELIIHNIDSDPDVDWDEESTAWNEDIKLIRRFRDEISIREGLTGAQESAATNIATVLFKNGPERALDMVEPERIVVINRSMMCNPWNPEYAPEKYLDYATATGITRTVDDESEDAEEDLTVEQMVEEGYLATFQLSDERWPGVAKTVEEMGELGQVLGKLMSCGGLYQYPWGGPSFKDKLEEEIGDLLGCLFFMMNHCDTLDSKTIINRATNKTKLFEQWAIGNTDVTYDEIANPPR